QNKRQIVLSNSVTAAILNARLGTGVSQTLETERALVEMRRLLGVANIKFNVIRALERQKIFLCRWRTFLFWSSNCGCHKLPPRFLAPSAFSKYKIDNPPSQGRGTRWFTSLPFPSARAMRRFFQSADRRATDPRTGADAIAHRSTNSEFGSLHSAAARQPLFRPSRHR